MDLAANKAIWSSEEVSEFGVLSDDVTHYASWTDNDEGTEIQLWNIKRQEKMPRFLRDANAVRVALSRDGRYMACHAADKVLVWDTTKDAPIIETELPHVTCIAFSPTGLYLAVATEENAPLGDEDLRREKKLGEILRWDVFQKKKIGAPLNPLIGAVTCLALSKDGTVLVAGTVRGGEVCRIDVDSGKAMLLPQHAERSA